MLNIILHYKKNDKLTDLTRYIKHINNINIQIKLNICIIILNCGKSIVNINEDINLSCNVNALIYNYNSEYSDSILNEIVKLAPYDYILFTNFHTYLTDIFFEWISFSNLDNNTYVRTNVVNLKKISNKFFDNYDNEIYNEFYSNIISLNNEEKCINISGDEYKEEFNNNKEIINIPNEKIKESGVEYINNVEDFLLVKKETLLNVGFHINNYNINYTYQYLLLSLINNGSNMIKLPLIISCYKLESKITLNILDKNIKFLNSIDYSDNINYKLYNISTKKVKSYIRNHIRNLKGYDALNTVKENSDLKFKNKELESEMKEKDIKLNIICEKIKFLEKENEKYKDNFVDVNIHNNLKNINIDKISTSLIEFEILINKKKELINKFIEDMDNFILDTKKKLVSLN